MNLSSLRILSDENIPASAVAYLRTKNIDVLDVKEEEWFGTSDQFILEKSHVERRFVLTQDSDFGTLAVHQGKRFHGIIHLRLRNQQPSNVVNVLDRFFRLQLELEPNAIVVVKEMQKPDEISTRIRRLDDKSG